MSDERRARLIFRSFIKAFNRWMNIKLLSLRRRRRKIREIFLGKLEQNHQNDDKMIVQKEEITQKVIMGLDNHQNSDIIKSGPTEKGRQAPYFPFRCASEEGARARGKARCGRNDAGRLGNRQPTFLPNLL